MEAIILAGGLGTRLASRLNGIPKPMASVAGRPFLDILLNQLSQVDCMRVLLSVGHLHNVIRDHFGDSYRGMRLDYVIERDALGTGGAIRAALNQASDDTVLVLNGDTFLQVNYLEMLKFHEAEMSRLTIAITHQADIGRYGEVVVTGKRITGFHEKSSLGPGWVNAGVYAIQRAIEWPKDLSERFSFERDFLHRELTALSPAAYKVNGLFLDIGIPEDLDRAQKDLACISL